MGGSLTEYIGRTIKLLRPDGHLLLSKRRSFGNILNTKRKQLSLLDKREYPNGGGSLTEHASKISNSSGLKNKF